MKKFVRYLFFIVFAGVFTVGCIIFIGIQQSTEKTEVKPFGISLGLKDVSLIEKKSLRRDPVDYVSIAELALSTDTYEKLDPKGYCRSTFGEKLIAKSIEHTLVDVPAPLKLPETWSKIKLTENVIYKVKIHPIRGVFEISAILNPKVPEKFIGTPQQWRATIHAQFKEHVLPALEQKYPNIITKVRKDSWVDFDSQRTDQDGRSVTINLTGGYSTYGKGTILKYSWDYLGIFDAEPSKGELLFKKCDAELDPIRKAKLKKSSETYDSRMKEQEEHERENQRRENAIQDSL